MNELYLKEPTLDDKDAVQGFVDEFMENCMQLHGSDGMDKEVTYEQWLEKIKTDEARVFTDYDQTEMVPCVTLLCYKKNDGILVGCVNIRKHLSKSLDEKFAGTIGWSIRPSLQRKGYGKQMGLLCLDYCKALGMNRVRVGCRAKNHGSRKIIEFLGGKKIAENNAMAKEIYYEVTI